MKAAAITSSVPWQAPPKKLLLDSDEVHVWRATLDHPLSRSESFWRLLAPDEQARAARFYFARDRDHFILARGMLRAILGRYLDLAPEGLSIGYGSHGKPMLVGEPDQVAVRFNLSHSHDVAVYAIARDREVGIDVERLRSDVVIAEIAERFFSRQEVAMLQALSLDLRRDAFFRCWTRKEAYIKARGEGLSLPLDQFDVSLDPAAPAALLGTRPDRSEASRWSLQDLDPAPGYAAALAVAGGGCRLAYWQWPSA